MKGQTSSQDGGIGRHVALPCTTIRRIATNLKTRNTQNYQKIKLYGNLTTRELKKSYSSRWVGGVEMGQRDALSGWRQGRWNGPSHIRVGGIKIRRNA